MLLQYISIFQLYSVLEIVLALHLDMNMISRDFMNMFVESLIQFWIGLSGWHIVGVVLRLCLSANALYAPGHVVDRGCDIPVESFVVHSLSIELSRTRLQGRDHYSVLDFSLRNVPYS
jgi:hypothetical protein